MSGATTVHTNGAASQPADVAFLRRFSGVPDGVSDAEVVAGVEAMRAWHLAREAEAAARSRAASLTSGWRDTPPGESSFFPFPTATLPAAAAANVRAQAAALDVDEAAVGVATLVALAAAVGNAYAIAPKRSWTERAAVWAVLVMPSGAKKSGAVEAAVAPALAIEAETRAEREAELATYNEEMARWKKLSAAEKKRTDEPDEPEQRPRLRVGDTTVESVAVVHADNPRGLLLYRDELSAWLGSFDRYASGDADLANWIEMCGGRVATIDRKSNKDRPNITVALPNVSVIGTTQPKTLRQRLGPPHFDSGFAARLLFVEPPARPRRWSDADVTRDVSEGYAGLIRQLYGIAMPAGGPTVLPLSAEARTLFVAFYNEHADVMNRTAEGPLRASLSKLEAYALRLALVLHVAEAQRIGYGNAPGPVSAEAVARGIQLTRWLRREQARVYAIHGFSDASLDRDERTARRLPETFTWQDVKEAWQVSKSGAYNVIERLLSKGLAEDVSHGTYRRLAERDTPGGLLDFLDFGSLGPSDV